MTLTPPVARDNQQQWQDLHHLLEAQDWRAADAQTLDILLQLTQRQQARWLDEPAIARIPCTDLHHLDWLWREVWLFCSVPALP
jgi:hypothetical protein